MTEITPEHIRVFKDVRDKGCVVNYYYMYPTPYYGSLEEEMPREDWHLLQRLIRPVTMRMPTKYQVMEFQSDESDYLTWTDATDEFTDDAYVTGTYRRYLLTPAALELLNG